VHETPPREDDFEREDFFTKPFVKTDRPAFKKKQCRVELPANFDPLNSSVLLWVTCPAGRVFLDTGSDISLARRDLLLGLHLFLSPVAVEHLGGEAILQEAGSFNLDGIIGLLLYQTEGQVILLPTDGEILQ
jgi:hypothetical protein